MFKFGQKVKIVRGEMYGYISHAHPNGNYYSVQVTHPARLTEPLICYPHQLKSVPKWRNFDECSDTRRMFGCTFKIWQTGKVEVHKVGKPGNNYLGYFMRPARRSSNLI